MGRVRASYTSKFKLQVVRYAEENSNREAGRKFDVDEKNVRRWILIKDELERTSQNRQAFRGKKAQYPELENDLMEFVRKTRADGFSVSVEMLQFEGRKIAERMDIPESQFKASYGWARRFIARQPTEDTKDFKMPRCCSIAGCKSRYKSENVSAFFPLPSNRKLRKIWLRTIPTDLTKVKNPIICSKHFPKDSIMKTEQFTINEEMKTNGRFCAKLKPGIVPSIFPNSPDCLSATGPSCGNRKSTMEEVSFVKCEQVWPDEYSSLEVHNAGYEPEPHVSVKQEILVKEEVQDTETEEIYEEQLSYSESDLFTGEEMVIVKNEVGD